MIESKIVTSSQNISASFLKEPQYDPVLVKKAIEWHDRVIRGYKITRRSPDNEIVKMYVSFNESC